MGSSSSKSYSSSSSSSADIESVFADMFADAMERADWHGKRKPTWQQAHDHFIVQMREPVTVKNGTMNRNIQSNFLRRFAVLI